MFPSKFPGALASFAFRQLEHMSIATDIQTLASFLSSEKLVSKMQRLKSIDIVPLSGAIYSYQAVSERQSTTMASIVLKHPDKVRTIWLDTIRINDIDDQQFAELKTLLGNGRCVLKKCPVGMYLMMSSQNRKNVKTLLSDWYYQCDESDLETLKLDGAEVQEFYCGDIGVCGKVVGYMQTVKGLKSLTVPDINKLPLPTLASLDTVSHFGCTRMTWGNVTLIENLKGLSNLNLKFRSEIGETNWESTLYKIKNLVPSFIQRRVTVSLEFYKYATGQVPKPVVEICALLNSHGLLKSIKTGCITWEEKDIRAANFSHEKCQVGHVQIYNRAHFIANCVPILMETLKIPVYCTVEIRICVRDCSYSMDRLPQLLTKIAPEFPHVTLKVDIYHNTGCVRNLF